MPLSLLITIAALVLFLGLRERLQRILRMHSALVLHLAELTALLDRRRATMNTMEELCQEHLPAAGASLEALARARRASSEAAARLGIDPTDVDALVALARSEVDMNAGLTALVSEAQARTTPAQLEALLAELGTLHQAVIVQARSFDHAAQAYNGLRAQAPASWLARLWGLGRAHALGLG